MRVLVDACIWSLALRRKVKGSLTADEVRLVARLTEVIQDGNVVMIGPIRQEILSEIKDQSQFEKTEKLLAPFPDEEPGSLDYVEAARLFNLCRGHGVQCGPIDMLLCSVAVRKHCVILTNDHGLLRCIDVLRRNKILPPMRSQG